jgi:hypothetical protein
VLLVQSSVYKWEYVPPSRWEIVSHITEKIKVQRNSQYSQVNMIRFSHSKWIYPVEVSGYDFLTQIWSNYKSSTTINVQGNQIIFSENDIQETIDITGIYTSFRNEYETLKTTDLQEYKIEFDINLENYIWKIIISHISIFKNLEQENNDDVRQNQSISWVLLLKRK